MPEEEKELIAALKVIQKVCSKYQDYSDCEAECPLTNQYGCIFARDVEQPEDWQLDGCDPLKYCF